MPDTVIINITTPPEEPVEVNASGETTEIDVEVNSVGETGPTGPPGPSQGSLNYVIDAGENVITTGVKGFIEWPFDATVSGWSIFSDIVGSIVVDVWSDAYGNFPPTLSDSIAGTEKPTLASAQKNQDLSLTSFVTTVAGGDVWSFNVDSVTDLKKVTIAFRFNKT